MTTTKLFAAVLMLGAITVPVFGEWRYAVENIAYNAPYTIADIYRTKKEAEVRKTETLGQVTIQTGACGTTEKRGKNQTTVETTKGPNGEPCIAGTPEERMEIGRQRNERNRDDNQTAIEAARIAKESGADVSARASGGIISAGLGKRYAGVSCSTLQADGSTKLVVPTPAGCR